MKIVYTKHAEEMLAFRKIKKKQVEETIKNPDKKSEGRGNKSILYRNFDKVFIKVVTSKDKDNIIVITQHWIEKKRVKT